MTARLAKNLLSTLMENYLSKGGAWMTTTPAIANPSTEDFGTRLNTAMDDYTAATNTYYAAVKTNLAAAKAQLGKAKTFEEKKYWSEQMEYYTSELRRIRYEAAAVIGFFVVGGILVYALK